MRDIRQDLRERLESIRAERERVQAQLEQLKRSEQTLQQLLTDENQRWAAKDQRSLVFASHHESNGGDSARSPLSQAIVAVLKESDPCTLGELCGELQRRGFDFEGKNPKRVANFALQALKHHGVVNKLPTGQWSVGAEDEALT